MLARELGAVLEIIDITAPAAREAARELSPEDVAVIGVPTYAGRVPNKILPYIQQKLAGNGALALPVVTFGNRSYDNSLSELCHELESDGFRMIAGAALPAEHAFSARLATGRPDSRDMEALRDFARQAAKKINGADDAQAMEPLTVKGDFSAPYYTPLGLDGEPAVFLKAKPKTARERCTECGLCAKSCPMGSISLQDPAEVEGTCIKCQACIKVCPTGAKYFDDPAFLSHVAMLEKNYTRRAEAEYFW